MEQSEQSGTGVVEAITDDDGGYTGAINFVQPGGNYTGRVEVTFDGNFPELDPQLRLSVYQPGGGSASGSVRRDMPPGELRELAAALNMAADACERARQTKAA